MNTTDSFRKLWDAGYHRLVPVVPPKAELHERSSLHARLAAGDDSRGKAPGILKDGKWRGMNFVAMESHEEDLPRWGESGASVGIKTGEGLVALDIDTTDRASAEQLYTLAAEILGPAAVRFGRKPKCLMLYEAPTDTTYQQVVFSTPTEDAARVELLSEGRQFVAQGMHPVTGKPYAWPQGIPRRDQLTRVTQEQIERFMREAASKLPNARRGAERGTAEAPDQETLKAPDWETLEKTVEAIPNTSALFPERDDYVAVAYAIKAAAPDGYEHAALDLFLDWCERWQDGENDQTIAMNDWGRAKPPFRTGFSFLRSRAVNLFFEPVSPQEADVAADMFKEATASQSSPYKLLDLDDVFNLPEPKFLIDRHLPETGFGLLYGDPGCGKSFIALDMGLSIAFHKNDWHGDKIEPRNGGRVLYIAGEGTSGFRSRAKAWIAHNLTPEQAHTKPNIKFLFQSINFMVKDDIRRLLEAVKSAEFGDIAFIVVDTVSRSIPGADENLQKDMTTFVAACDALREETGAFVLGVHHTAKSGEMRGSSVFAGQADVVLHLTRKKGAQIGTLACVKQKDAPDGWHDAYRLTEINLPDGTSSLCPERVEGGPEGEELAPALAASMLDFIEAAWVEGKPLSKAPQAKDRYAPRVLYLEFGISAGMAESTLELWERTGLLEIAPCGRGGRKQGYRVIRDDSDTDDTSAETSIFG